jgi:hypothetical protein
MPSIVVTFLTMQNPDAGFLTNELRDTIAIVGLVLSGISTCLACMPYLKRSISQVERQPEAVSPKFAAWMRIFSGPGVKSSLRAYLACSLIALFIDIFWPTEGWFILALIMQMLCLVWFFCTFVEELDERDFRYAAVVSALVLAACSLVFWGIIPNGSALRGALLEQAVCPGFGSVSIILMVWRFWAY